MSEVAVTDWIEVSVDVTADSHVFKWVYDRTQTTGEDINANAWVDEITIANASNTVVWSENFSQSVWLDGAKLDGGLQELDTKLSLLSQGGGFLEIDTAFNSLVWGAGGWTMNGDKHNYLVGQGCYCLDERGAYNPNDERGPQ